MCKRIWAVIAFLAVSVFAFPTMANASDPDDNKPGYCSAYRYVGEDGGTICEDYPGDADRDCGTDNIQQVKLLFGTDPWKLDRDDNGIGCETVDSVQLPKTGSATALLIGVGTVLPLAGVMVLVALHRRRVRFEA